MGWKKEVLVKRSMLRHNVPGGLSTGIHYDRIFLRYGEAEFLTAWVPIGDCAANGGGLMYIEGSTQIGKTMEADFMERAKDMPDEERLSGFNKNMAANGQLAQDAASFGAGKGKWLTANYEAGDVVFHNPYMIHGAVKNEDCETGRIRLSTDLRFYEEGSDLDHRWMQKYWAPDDGL
jgi:phytanoyl-CoA hydroxylase